RSAMALAHRPRPLPRDPTPWHALEPQAVLERTGSGPDGLSPAEAGRRLPPRQEELARPLRLARDMADELVHPLPPIPAGDAVPADLRILSSEWLEVDESSLTGESLPVEKDAEPTFALILAERSSMLYDGSSVAAGEAMAVVVATGAATEARRAVAAGQEAPATGVEARLQYLTALTVPVAIGSGVVTMGVGLLRRQPFGQLAAGAVSLA